MKKTIALLLTSAIVLSACSADKEPIKEPIEREEQKITKKEQQIIDQFHPFANNWYEVDGEPVDKEKIRQTFVTGIQKHLGIQTNIPLNVLEGWDKQGSKGEAKDRFFWKPISPELPVTVTLTEDTPYKDTWKDHDGYFIEANLIANAETDIDRLNWYIHKNTFDILQELSKTTAINVDGITVRWKVPIYKDNKKKEVTFQTFEEITLTLDNIKKVKTIKDIEAPIQSFGSNGFFHKWAGSASYIPEFDKEHKDYGKYTLYKVTDKKVEKK